LEIWIRGQENNGDKKKAVEQCAVHCRYIFLKNAFKPKFPHLRLSIFKVTPLYDVPSWNES